MSVIRNDDDDDDYDDSSNFGVRRPDMQCTFLAVRGDIVTRRKHTLFVFALSWTDRDNVIHCNSAPLKGSSFLFPSIA